MRGGVGRENERMHGCLETSIWAMADIMGRKKIDNQ